MPTKKRVRTPFRYQKNVYTCGPAVLQMVFAYFRKRYSQKLLAHIARTTEEAGTDHSGMIRAATSAGFYSYVNDNSSFHEIAHFLAHGLPVIVNYIGPSDRDGHYAVIVGFNNRDVILNDPWNGKGFRISKRAFLRNWHDYKNVHKQWIMVIAKDNFAIGKQFLPATKPLRAAKRRKSK